MNNNIIAQLLRAVKELSACVNGAETPLQAGFSLEYV
jgi:hypothetical protein